MPGEYQPLQGDKITYSFLQGGGEIGALTRAFDWSGTALGSPESWPQSLRTTLRIVLHSASPMFLFWGEELTCFYNDAYRPSLGSNGKHPAVGRPGKDVWPETWDFIGPLIAQVMATGQPVWFDDQLVPIYRNGQLEDVYWTFSYSPAFDDDQITGVLVTCSETTRSIRNLQKLEESNDQLAFAIDAAELGTWDLNPATNRFVANAQLKDWFGLLSEDEIELTLATNVIADKDRQRVVNAIGWALQYASGGHYDIEYTIIHPLTKQARMIRAKGRAWFATDQTAYRFNGTLQDITEQKKSSEELVRFKYMAENASDPFILMRQDGTFAYLNQLALDRWGYTADEARHIRVPDVDPVYNESVFAHAFASAQTGKLPLFETLHRRKDGSIYPVEINMGGLVLNGEPHLFAVARDITDRKKAEETLRESEARFRLLIEEAPVATCLFVGRELTIEIANEAMIGVWGKGRSVIGMTLADALPELAGQPFLPLLDELFVTGNTHETKARRADLVVNGELGTYYFDYVFKPLRNAAGEVYAIMEMAIDVTKQIVVQQQQQQLAAIVENLPTYVTIANLDGTMRYINPFGQHLLGLSSREVPGKQLEQFFEPVDMQILTEEALPSLFTRHQWEGQLRMRHFQTGELIPVAVTALTLLDPATGNPEALVALNRDLRPELAVQQRQAAQLQALAESEERFQAAVVAVQGVLWTNNAAGEMAGEQPGWSALTGQTYDEYQGFGWADAVHPDDAQATTNAWLEAVSERRMFVFEHRVRTRTGVWGLFSIRAIPLLNADGRVREWVGVHTNITEQRQAEQALIESEQFSRNIFDDSPVANLVFVGPDMIIRTVNGNMLEMLGRDTSIIGKPFMDAVPELVPTPLMDRLRHVLTTGENYYQPEERINLVRHGKPYAGYFNYIYKALQNTVGERYGVIVTATEVTGQVLARHKVEEAQANLSQTNQRLSLALDTADLGSYELDLETGAMSCTAQCKANYGWDPDKPFNFSDLLAMIVADDRAGVQQAVDAAVSTRTTYHAEYRITWPDGSLHWVKTSGQPAYTPDGRPVRMIGVIQDITAQRMAREELEHQVQERTRELQESILDLSRSNQNLQQFAYIASHDLQEPLRKVQQFGDLLSSQYANQLGEGVNHLQRMRVAASRMSVLIKDLLTFSRISTQQENTAPVHLTEVVQTALNDLEMAISETGAQVSVEPLPTVQGDATQLSQLFQNLLSNALKFRRSGTVPTLRVTVQRVAVADLPDSVNPTRAATYYQRIDVADNGIGFDQKYADRIFQVFQRLHSKNEFPGTGIGLAICEKVAANHGGAISALSTPGQGATFSVFLPAGAGSKRTPLA